MYESFGDWLKRELENQGHNQADLSRAIGKTTAHVAKMANDKSKPSPETASAIAVFLGVPEIEVFRRAGISKTRATRSPFLEFMEESGEKLSEDEQIDVMDFVKAKLARKSRSQGVTK